MVCPDNTGPSTSVSAPPPSGSTCRSPTPRRLVVNADDFGRSAPINQAVIRAHQEGILTSASLMVNEPGFEEAVALARQHSGLGVGLHLSLVCGRAALKPSAIPHLVGSDGCFSSNPVAAGFGYYALPGARAELEREIAAQFERFHCTKLELDHVNGHLHLHLHPVVFGILMRHAERWGIRRLRWSRDPFWLNTRLARGRWLYRLAHTVAISAFLCGRARPILRRRDIRHTDRVFGMLQDGRADEKYVLGLLRALPAGDSELYSHPSPDEFKHELDALVSPRVRNLVSSQGIELVRYRDL